VFFKFEATEDAEYVHSAAAVASKKLRHVKKVYSWSSRCRSLLVTESVCAARPISLDEFLGEDSAVVLPALKGIVDDVVQQLEQLGASTEMTKPVKDILWPHFQMDRIRKSIDRWMTPEFSAMADVVRTFEALKNNSSMEWVKVRQCNHGDLHAKNVAIDKGSSPIRAFIFDTGAMSSAVNVRDLSLIEVTCLLFQKCPEGGSLVQACESFYADKVEPGATLDVATESHQVRNTKALIAAIRQKALGMCEAQVYALSVFDNALMELSGLAVQSASNKINQPRDAARLAAMSAAWLIRVATSWSFAIPPMLGHFSADGNSPG